LKIPQRSGADEPLWYYLAVSLARPERWFIAPWPIALIHVMPRQKGLLSGKLKQQENY
jgi:hypothetical protein